MESTISAAPTGCPDRQPHPHDFDDPRMRSETPVVPAEDALGHARSFGAVGVGVGFGQCGDVALPVEERVHLGDVEGSAGAGTACPTRGRTWLPPRAGAAAGHGGEEAVGLAGPHWWPAGIETSAVRTIRALGA